MVNMQRGMTLILILGLVMGVSAGDSIPSLPQEFWGGVTIDGSPAPAGTVIVAMIDGNESGSVTTTVSGRYGGSAASEGKHLVVSGTEGQEGHTVAFLVDGQTAQETTPFTSGIVTQLDLNAWTTVDTGSIAVTSVPSSAAIFLDGVDTGQMTNGTLTGIPAGSHTVTVTLAGYLSASSQVTVVAGQTASVHFDLVPETGSIAITSVPAGASILLDGIDYGKQTNITLTNIPVGIHTITVQKTGYLTASSEVTVSSGQTASVHFGLVPETGSIAVTSVPAGAAIFLDGADTGQVTNGTLTGIPVGSHTVAVQKTGYLTASSEVTVVRDETASVHFDLATPVHPPTAGFTAAPADGAVPLSVQFTDTSTNATVWSWAFGDGGTSTEWHPAHTYTAIGRYNVTLTVTNTAGSDTLTRYRYISVRDVPPEPAVNETDYAFHDDGTNVTTVDGRQQVSFDAAAGNGTVSGDDILLSTNNLNVTIRTDGLNTSGTASTGNVTGVLLESSKPTTAAFDEAGNVSVAFNSSMNRYNPDLRISLSIYDQPSDLASTAFTLAATGEGLEITSTAYAVYFTKTNLGANDTISDAYLRLTVSPAWVEANGGTDAIRIFRQGDDGETGILDTTYLGLDADGMMVFEAYSPDGFSAFAVAATKAVVTPTPTPSSSSSGGGGGGSSVTPTTSTGTAELLTASWGGVLRPYVVYTDGRFAHLSIQTGVTALDRDGNPLPEVGITAVSTLLSASSLTFSGYAVDCTPDGAVFSPAISLAFTFTEEEWAVLLANAGGDPSRLIVQGYEPSAGTWEDLPTHVDAAARTVTASISHFSTYGLFIGAAAEEPVTTGPTVTPTATVTAGAAAPTPPTGTGELPMTWIVLVIVIGAAAVIAGYVVVKRR